MGPNYLFTYGWLQRRFHRQLPFQMPKTYVGKAYTYGQLYRVADYPGVRLVGKEKVFGEVFAIDPSFDWTEMDVFEVAKPTILEEAEYQRVITTCYTDQQEVSCWIYEYLKDCTSEQLIKSGFF